MMIHPQKIWQSVMGELELILSKANFTTWFENTFIVDISEDKGEVVIGVPNGFTQSWFEKKYHHHILKAINNLCENKIKNIIYEIKSFKKTPPKSVDSLSAREPTVALPSESQIDDSERILNRRYVFDNFIVGKCNQLAHSAGLAVAETPGTRYNPLFIYGDVGLGKTHLLHAIGNAIKNRLNVWRVVYASFEKFTNDYIKAARRDGFETFRQMYREADVLLIDDVQFMIDKEKTQEEFFNTFEVLHQSNKQIVITSDRPPKALVELQDRMISRFQWGMIADIKPPDVETRTAIIKNKCQERNFFLEEELVRFIAENIKNSIRELEGVINKIVGWYELNRKDPTISSVKEILTDFLINPAKRALNYQEILKAVAEYYQLPLEDIIGPCRKREMVVPRQVAMYLMREELNHSFPTIGHNLGGRDHTTVMYACEKMQELLNEEERLRQEVESIRQRLYK